MADILKDHSAFSYYRLNQSLTLKMKALQSFKTLGNTQQCCVPFQNIGIIISTAVRLYLKKLSCYTITKIVNVGYITF